MRTDPQFPSNVTTRRSIFRLGAGFAAAATAYAASTIPSQATGRHSDPFYCEPLCLLEGASVLTARGSTPVEELQVGDEVVTVSGELKKITWVGVHVYTRNAGEEWPKEVDPVFIASSAIEANAPSSGLYVSPRHSLLIDGYLVPARYLVNGSSVRQGEFTADEIRYHHFRCDEHEVVFADGLAVETLQWKLDALTLEPGEDFSGPEMLEPYAPVLGYWNKRDETLALLRRVTSKCVDMRDPLQVIHDRVAGRAAERLDA